ncbi:acetyl-CoA carboxylase biotin carboxyl carrier protein [Cupriavidus taiwanensis]|uniref:Biotin carboxyl carrier protein of acetyl-CoA carboxylase n=1 Tax=Cupriavidus taiwanensis TaxID=164546 RepID=A0A7Z7NRX0_9BURK|nr:biotin/lipoyl-containing protein [Cupriavidus taiwanensis]SOZ19519.1 putative Biotin carboxyl carrier protein of acetyl-CoA carboxylase [Cupriavidus taiwanensis]SOZ97293.1 putative Biotin carboxyl carrier protein of acetyl-CoA carboxylase [Cupriavidus taiwanensis]SPC26182.1 putative Biotin carboxyl carrier protein of acetyl-CoA carboxylase [Cupriavidus taiwanensis]SPD37686.1 putative Biotin carboxyl carrier protein of acetyl-CoA carboxylase [Cupriavidus taiwanensis]
MSNEAMPERLELLNQLAGLFDQANCTEFEFEGSGFSLKLKRGAALSPPPPGRPVDRSPSARGAVKQATGSAPGALTDGSTRHTVRSGITGMYFKAPSPDKPPFVAVGDRVEVGQTLCLVEAMKMLNPIDSDCAGTVVEILQADGASVASGASLFVIEVSNV